MKTGNYLDSTSWHSSTAGHQGSSNQKPVTFPTLVANSGTIQIYIKYAGPTFTTQT